MRYRAWHATAQKMIEDETFVGEVYLWLHQGQPLTIIRPTGLKDKNGKEIYEGDVLHIKRWETRGEVIFKDGMFKVRLKSDSTPSLATFMGEVNCKVIGNIYENPELLDGEPQ